MSQQDARSPFVIQHDRNIFDASDPVEYQNEYLKYKMRFWVKINGEWVKTFSTFGATEMLSYTEWKRAEL